MKKLISMLICFTMLMTFAPTIFAETSDGNIYYVSPTGSNSNNGTTTDTPWKTFAYAAKTAKAGDTVIFADGTYNEDALTIVVNSGTEAAPIVFKSANKHGAIINYALTNANKNAKLQINSGKEYIEIRDFVFTQETPSESSTSDIMIRVYGGNHCKIIGNDISNIYEEGIKMSNAHDIVVEDNTITGAGHEGIDSVNSFDCVIRGNQIIDCGRTGVMIKGNSRNFMVYNNLVMNPTVKMANGGYAFTVGGATSISSGTTLVDYETGYEAYNCIFYNNVVHGGDAKNILTAFAYIGAKDCHCYNNTIIGAEKGFTFASNGGLSNGWGWNVTNLNPVIKNNIISNVTNAFVKSVEPTNLVSDYNLYYEVTNSNSVPAEMHGKAGNPDFADNSSDWAVFVDSPAAGAGVELPDEVDGFEGYASIEGVTENKRLPIEKIDFSGNARKLPWDIGACNRGNEELLYEDFESGTAGEDINGWNGWSNTSTSNSSGTLDATYKILQEDGNKVGNITRTNCSSATSKGYNSVKTITNDSGRFVGLKFKVRADIASTGAFTLKLYDADSSLSLIQYFNNRRLFFGASNLYINGGSTPLTTGQWYNYEVYFDLVDSVATLYINNVEIFDSIAHTLSSINKIQIESDRTMGAVVPAGHDGSSVIADIKIDDIIIQNITGFEYDDVIGAVPDDSYLFRETFSRTEQGSLLASGYNGWTLSGTKSVAPIRFALDPSNSSNTVLAFQRTGVPGSQQILQKTFTAADDGYYSFRFKIRSENERDNYFKATIIDNAGQAWDVSFDLQSGTVGLGFLNTTTNSHNNLVEYFNTGNTKITRNKWYSIEIVLDLTDDATGYISVYVDGRKVADHLSAANSVSSACKNNSSIGAIRFIHNRTHGSSLLLADMPDSAVDTPYDAENTLIANIMLDDIELQAITAEEAGI